MNTTFSVKYEVIKGALYTIFFRGSIMGYTKEALSNYKIKPTNHGYKLYPDQMYKSVKNKIGPERVHSKQKH